MGKMTKGWKLAGYDSFSEEWYGIDGPDYSSEAAAQAAAWEKLKEIETLQPSAQSGGQSGIQDRVYIQHPDGERTRVFPA